MIFGIYSIRDTKCGFLQPSLDQNNEVAVRNFEHAIQRVDSLFFTHPQDYSIYKIAEFDTDSGIITPIQPIQHLADADALLRKE